MKQNYYLVCYDIADEKRLRKVARIMEDFGIRVLYSVFECRLTPEEFAVMRQTVEEVIDALEDRVRYYRLCETCRRPVVHLGYGKHTRLPEGDHLIL
ncbi:CRISPR-associated endonuclease Cas2 [Thermosulfurimonas sp. F29]|uniref:CRISPR-associated endonuclease Cas2 n=1 Tax=Thermosulfurimonas sp. F29 TaxID=2867247 RepID=UPI001C8409D2|nr:CRISPR-associated endonuclease Cas2 [Thermosulfurimonas sp. F29]MBX6423222.1 CRISPR-associated endonuclease Cas2 [Thermosulfurimonas sp. F29]